MRFIMKIFATIIVVFCIMFLYESAAFLYLCGLWPLAILVGIVATLYAWCIYGMWAEEIVTLFNTNE